MGLGAVLEEKLDIQDRALRLEKTHNEIHLKRKYDIPKHNFLYQTGKLF